MNCKHERDLTENSSNGNPQKNATYWYPCRHCDKLAEKSNLRTANAIEGMEG